MAAIVLVVMTAAGCSGKTGTSEWNEGAPPASAPSAAPTAAAASSAAPAPIDTVTAPAPTQSAVKAVTIANAVVPQANPKSTGFRWTSPGTPRDGFTAANFGEEAIRKGIDPLWSNWLNSNTNLHDLLINVRVVKGGTAYTSQCSPDQKVVAGSPRAFLCPADDPDQKSPGILWLPSETYYQIWVATPFSAAEQNFVGVVVAADLHAYGIMQTLIMELNLPVPSGAAAQQVTACYAGIATRAIYPGTEIKSAPIDAALGIIRAGVGLDGTADKATIKAAYDNGLVNGDVAKCGQYWPGTTWN